MYSGSDDINYSRYCRRLVQGKINHSQRLIWVTRPTSTVPGAYTNRTTGSRRTVTPVNPLTPNDHYIGRTAPLTSKRCNLYIYSTNIGTEYFKHGIYSPIFSLQNAVCFKILTYLVPVLFTFCIEGVLKFTKLIPAPKC